MVKWPVSWLWTIYDLLEAKGGYGITRALLSSNKIEKNIVSEVSGPTSTVEEWLQKAKEKGLVKVYNVKQNVRGSNRWSLYRDRLPEAFIPVIKERGKKWRDETNAHADVSGYSSWGGQFNIKGYLEAIDADTEAIKLDTDAFKM